MESGAIQFQIAGVLAGDPAEGERARLARDLHDGLAQELWFMNLQVRLLEDALRGRRFAQANQLVAELRQALESGYSEVRSLVDDLRQPATETDLASAMARLVQQFNRCGQASVVLEIDLRDAVRPSSTVAVQMALIAREALTNVAKHAAATAVRLRVETGNGEVRLVIADDGLGFDPTRRLDGRHLGLRSMRERVASLGGKIVVRSAPGYGTTIYVSAPLRMEWEREPAVAFPPRAERERWKERARATGGFAPGR